MRGNVARCRKKKGLVVDGGVGRPEESETFTSFTGLKEVQGQEGNEASEGAAEEDDECCVEALVAVAQEFSGVDA